MSTRTITVEHDGKTYSGQLARIDSTSFGSQDHGIVSAWLHCSWKSGGIGVGGFCLDTPKPKDQRAAGDYTRLGTAYGLDHLMQIMATVGVETWEKLPGQQVIVLFEDGRDGWGSTSVGIAGVLNDKVLILKQHADSWREAAEVAK
jgi:hypothetical protein